MSEGAGTWTALSSLTNALLSLVWGMPTTTMARCSLSRPQRMSMCTPDLNPPFAMLLSALRGLGGVFDRWLDTTYMLVPPQLSLALPPSV